MRVVEGAKEENRSRSETKPNPLGENTVIGDKRMQTVTRGVKKRKIEGLSVELHSRKKCSM